MPCNLSSYYRTQFRDPHGLLNSLQSVAQHEDVFYTLLDAAESFDTCMIRRSQFLTETQRGLLMQLATSPLPLTQQVRLYLRRLLGARLPELAPHLPLPKLLQQYLTYGIS
ncbi:hypothetical protein FOCC_FOCC006166 [Frankliniella occidentalis]|nr:hypothetical protein FOCC_FOCC006166 [Frankliniella occidentalis]